MHLKNKLVAAFALAVLVLPGVSLAQISTVPNASLQAQIQALLAQIQVLQAQLAAQGGTATTAPVWCYTFNNNLSIGMSGSAVTALQTALQKDGESVTVSGTFDDQTAAAVTGFQEKYASAILAPYGLSNGTGYVGAATRSELNSLFGCTGGTTNPITPPVHACPAWGCNGPEPVPTSTIPVGTPSITLTYPTGGEILDNGGKSQIATITWTSQNLGTLGVSIDLRDANNNTIRTIAGNIPNTGSYVWSNDPTLASGSYKVVISPVTFGPEPPEWASGLFTVNTDVTPTPLITITQPIAGDGYVVNQPLPVYWNQNYASKSVVVTLSKPVTGGADGIYVSQPITTVARGNGFTIPASAVSSAGQYYIQICDASVTPPAGQGSELCTDSDTFNVAAATQALSVTQNSAFPSGSVIAGTANQKIGSYAFSAPASEGVNLNSILLGVSSDGGHLQNLKLFVNGTQFSAIQAAVSVGGTHAFTASPISVPAGSIVIVDVYADILSNNNAGTQVTTSINSCAATGQTSFSAYQCPASPVQGQTTTITTVASSAPSSISIALSDVSQYGPGNSSAFITSSIAPGSQNSRATSWGLQVTCPSGVTLIGGKAGNTNYCGTTQTYYTSQIYNVNQGYEMLAAGATNTNNSNSYIAYSLTAYDANGNVLGNSQDKITLSAPTVSVVTPNITMVSPNGGEQWQQGNTYQVVWQRTNFNDAVAINLIDYTSGSRYGMQYGITNGLNVVTVPGQTSFSWTIPTSIPPGNYYKVVAGSGSVNGFSSNYFSIVSPTITTPAPTVTLSAAATTIAVGALTNVTWNATNATACTPSGFGSVLFPATAGTISFSANTAGTYNLSVTCTGHGGTSAPASVTITVTNTTVSTPAPTVTLSANPTTITANPSSGAQPTTLTWTSTNATACTISGSHGYNDNGAWSQSSLAPSGSLPIGPYPLSTTSYAALYQITCTGPGGTSQPSSATVTVNPAPASTPSLSIVSVSGLQSSYQANQPISFTLSGVQLPSNASADSSDGFNVQAGIPTVNGVNGSYDSVTGLWNVTIPAPSTAGTYTLTTYLYCGNTNASCHAQYANAASQVTKNFTLTVSPAAIATTTPAQGTLSFSPSSFSATYVQGSPLPSTLTGSPNLYTNTPYFQSGTFTNTSNVTVNFTQSVPNQPSWLNSGYGAGPYSMVPGQSFGLAAYLNPANVANTPGTYTTNIIITGNFVGSPKTIPVTLTVTPAPVTVAQPIGTLIPSTTFVNFNVVQGQSNPSPVQIILTNGSTASVNLTLSIPNQPRWLNGGYNTQPMTLGAGQTMGVGASVDATQVSGPGTYTTNLIVTGNFANSPISIPVTLTVTAAPAAPVQPSTPVYSCTNPSAACQSQSACTNSGSCSVGGCGVSNCMVPQQFGGCGGTWTAGCNGSWVSSGGTSMNTQSSGAAANNQTAIISQSLQDVLNRLNALLKSL